MARILALLMALLVIVQPTQAQNAPDYMILVENISYTDTNQTVILQFAVYNKGTAASISASVEVRDVNTDTMIVMAEGLVPPLASLETSQNLEIRFDATRYPPGSEQQIQLVVGRNEIESETASTFSDNVTAPFRLTIPQYTSQPLTPVPAQPPQPEPDTPLITFEDNVLRIDPLDLSIDLGDPVTLVLLAVIAVAIVLIALVLMLILRMIFGREPSFGNWQPPYANMPPLDPNSTFGRRQQWQPHAQNNTLPAPCRPGTVAARKLLLGMDGSYLSGWEVKALRLTQYDLYGRVSRSQVLASRKMINKLDRLSRRADRFNGKQIARRVRPIAKRLAKQFKKNITKRSAMLAIALDLRLEGSHGEVRIMFELYDCPNGRMSRLDYWEPEMTVLGKTIHESYTYTIFGQYGGETYRQFRKRLPKDVEQMLAEFLQLMTPQQAQPQQPMPTPSAQPTIEPPPESLSSTQPAPAYSDGVQAEAPKTEPRLDPVGDDDEPEEDFSLYD